MRLETERLDGGILCVKLEGRLDVAGTDTIAIPLASLAATDKGRLILDLSQVEFLASIGVRAILQNARAQHLRGGSLVVMNPSPLVQEVLEAAGVMHVVPIVPNLEAAQAALAR